MAARKLPDIGFVREALSYDPATGIFIWRAKRPAHHFPDAKTWNTSNLGTLMPQRSIGTRHPSSGSMGRNLVRAGSFKEIAP